MLLGPSGCGKNYDSTDDLLVWKKISEGTAVDGRKWFVNSVPPGKRKYSHGVFKNYALFPHLFRLGEYYLRIENPKNLRNRKMAKTREGSPWKY